MLSEAMEEEEEEDVQSPHTKALLRPSVPFDSFNTRDIHTVDRGVLRRLPQEIANRDEDGEDWAVLVAHFLGVDHVGHTFSPRHAQMRTKLQEMDRAFNEVLRLLGFRRTVVADGLERQSLPSQLRESTKEPRRNADPSMEAAVSSTLTSSLKRVGGTKRTTMEVATKSTLSKTSSEGTLQTGLMLSTLRPRIKR